MRSRRLRNFCRRFRTRKTFCLLVVVVILLLGKYGSPPTPDQQNQGPRRVTPLAETRHPASVAAIEPPTAAVDSALTRPLITNPAIAAARVQERLQREEIALQAAISQLQQAARHGTDSEPAQSRTHESPEATSFIDHVYTFAGSEISKDTSYGNVLPYVARPHAFNYWVPQTGPMDDNNKIISPWYSGSHTRFYGIRCTHQPSLWIGDWAFFSISFNLKSQIERAGSPYEPAKAIWKPHLFRTAYAISPGCSATVEVTSTMHGAVIRSTVPQACRSKSPPAVQFTFGPGKHSKAMEVRPAEDQDDILSVSGVSRQSGHAMTQPMDLFFYASVDTEQNGAQSCISGSNLKVSNKLKVFLVEPSACAEEEVSSDWVQIVRVATSLISEEQAKLNYNQELRGHTFDQVMQSSKDQWNLLLGRYDVTESGLSAAAEKETLQVVYTCMYRFLLFPSKIHEINSTGGVNHMSPYTEPHEVKLEPLIAVSDLK